nr:calcium-dependent protein kinase 17 [Tanacetum cinerariifolium]
MITFTSTFSNDLINQKELIQLDCEARLKVGFYVYLEAKMLFVIMSRGCGHISTLIVTKGCLSHEEIIELEKMFKGVYTDNSGTITVEELKHGLSKQDTRLLESKFKHFEAAYEMEVET